MSPVRSSQRRLDQRRLLVVTAVEAERQALLRGLGGQCDVDVVAGGVGVAAAAAATARALAEAGARSAPFAAVISAGIGGGFFGRADLGATVLATRSVAADLGAESPTGFLPLEELGFGASAYDADPELFAALRSALPDAVSGEVLTLSTVTGTAATTAALARRHPNAVAEAMEGFGVATAAAQAGVAFAEMRTISNLVGPRDRARWRIADALAALERAATQLTSLLP